MSAGVIGSRAMARDEVIQRVEAEPPVVARLVIEIRSDGSRTVARGALEQVGDPGDPQAVPGRVAVEARGGSPAALALDLLRSIMSAPFQSSLSQWTGRKGQADATVIDASEPRPGLIGRVGRGVTGRIKRRLGLR